MAERWITAEADQGTAASLLLQVSNMRCSCGWQGSGLLSIRQKEHGHIRHLCPKCRKPVQADISEWTD